MTRVYLSYEKADWRGPRPTWRPTPAVIRSGDKRPVPLAYSMRRLSNRAARRSMLKGRIALYD